MTGGDISCPANICLQFSIALKEWNGIHCPPHIVMPHIFLLIKGHCLILQVSHTLNYQVTQAHHQQICKIQTSGESCETTHSNLSPESLPETEKRSIKALAIKARAVLKIVTDLTYLCKDKEMLQLIAATVSTLEEKVTNKLPQDSGLLVRLKNIGCLKSYEHPAKKQKHWKCRNRVGSKADMLRKTYRVNINFYRSLNKYTPAPAYCP